MTKLIEFGNREQGEVYSVTVGKLHQVGESAVICWRRVLHGLGHLQNHQFTKTVYPGVVISERLDLSDKVEDVKILEDIARRVGVGTRAIHDHSTDAVIALRSVENEFKYFLFVTHTLPECGSSLRVETERAISYRSAASWLQLDRPSG